MGERDEPSGEPSPEDSEPMMFDGPRLSPERQQHVALMGRIAQAVTASTGDNFVLKGGTALLLGYGLPRFSFDLDFDGRRTMTDLRRSIESGAQAAAVASQALIIRKDTPTTKRYLLHYTGSSTTAPQRLKIEASFRRANAISEDDVAVVNGIRMYMIERLAPLKIDAFLDRTLGRDVFDTAFLLARYPYAIPDEQVVSIDAKVAELGEDGLLELMADDEILQAHDLDRVTLDMVDAVRQLRTARGV